MKELREKVEELRTQNKISPEAYEELIQMINNPLPNKRVRPTDFKKWYNKQPR